MNLSSGLPFSSTPVLPSVYHSPFDMSSELTACVKLTGDPYMLELRRFTTPVLAYPADLYLPEKDLDAFKNSKTPPVSIPIIVATDGRFTRRYARNSWAQVKGDMSSGVDGAYLLVFAEELTQTKEPTTVQSIFIFGRVLSLGRRVPGHITFDTVIAQPDSLRVR